MTNQVFLIKVCHQNNHHFFFNQSFQFSESLPTCLFHQIPQSYPSFYLPLISFPRFLPLLFPDLREFELHLFAVLSSLHAVQSALRRRDIFHFRPLRPSSVSDSMNAACAAVLLLRSPLVICFKCSMEVPTRSVMQSSGCLVPNICFSVTLIFFIYNISARDTRVFIFSSAHLQPH